MGVPKNPDTIIVKNKIHPQGLTEGMVWNYYSKHKGIILNKTQGRYIMLAIMVELNKPVLKRKGTGSKFIQLTNSNYENIINGRTLTIYSTIKAFEDFCIIDIDTPDWKKSKHITQFIYHQMMKSNFITTIKILYTGKNSFHLHCKVRNKQPINRIKTITETYLKQNQDHTLYTIQQKMTPQKPNIDLSPNKFNGAFITEGSLSLWGLKCMEVPLKQLKTFERWKAKI